MGQYILTEEQEDDFRFASAGKEFSEYLKESLEQWRLSALTNRRIVIQKSLQGLSDDVIQKVIDAADLRNHADIMTR